MSKELYSLRKKVDIIDKNILNLLGKRMNLSRQIGKVKKENGIPLLDEDRWKKVLQSKISKAESLKLSKEFIQKIYNLIHKYSLRIQKESI